MAFLEWKDMHINTHSWEITARGLAIMLIAELRKMVTTLKGVI